MSFRDDGAAAVEWVAAYLERVRDLPVLAQVEPGELRSRLPAAPPETAEPFAAVLRDLDDVLLPALTHWQSPRFFAYFANTGSEPGILAELLLAGLNQVGILWRTSPALQELEEVTLDWLAQLLGLPAGLHGHLEDTASTGTMAALAAAREAKPGARVVVCSEHAHSSVEKACRILGLEAADDAGRRRLSAPAGRARPRRRVRGRRDDRDDLDELDRSRSPRSRTRASAAASGCTSTPPTRARRPSARSCATRSPAGSAPTRSSSTRTSGCSRRWAARRSGRGGRTTSGPRSASCPSTCA